MALLNCWNGLRILRSTRFMVFLRVPCKKDLLKKIMTDSRNFSNPSWTSVQDLGFLSPHFYSLSLSIYLSIKQLSSLMSSPILIEVGHQKKFQILSSFLFILRSCGFFGDASFSDSCLSLGFTLNYTHFYGFLKRKKRGWNISACELLRFELLHILSDTSVCVCEGLYVFGQIGAQLDEKLKFFWVLGNLSFRL